MNKLVLDKSYWTVQRNIDGTYWVASEGTQKVIAPSVSLSVGMQLVDEHTIALQIYKTMAHYPNTPLMDHDGTVYERPKLVEAA